MSNSLSGLDIPASGSGDLFMKKLEPGPNKMRILTTPIVGYVWWPEDENKPVRVKEAGDIKTGEDAKYFWFLTIAINNTVKFLELKQKTILSQIKALSDNKDWAKCKIMTLRSHVVAKTLKHNIPSFQTLKRH